MLKHKFNRSTNACITKRLTEGNSLPLKNRPKSMPDIEHSRCYTRPGSSKKSDQNLRSIKPTRSSKGVNLTKKFSIKKNHLEPKLEYTGASLSSLSQGSRFSTKYFCKQNRIFGEEVVIKNTTADEESQKNTNVHPFDKTNKFNSNIVYRLLITNWKVFLGIVLGISIALIAVRGIGICSSNTSGITYIYEKYIY